MSSSLTDTYPASEIEKPSRIKIVAEALKLHHQDKPLAKDDVASLFFSMAEYVYKAWKAGLGKRSECAYAGSLLLYQTLKRTGSRFASDVEDANRIWQAGMKLAEEIWNKLESLRNNPPSGESSAFKKEIQAMSSMLWEEYQRIDISPAGRVERKGWLKLSERRLNTSRLEKGKGSKNIRSRRSYLSLGINGSA